MSEHFPRVRAHITLTLRTVSPLHIGHGLFDDMPGQAEREGQPKVAALLAGHDQRPIIPGTSLKGLLRRVGEASFRVDADGGRSAVDRLFGVIRDSKEDAATGTIITSGSQGAISIYPAKLKSPGTASAAPLAGQTSKGNGVFVLARTRVDRASGTADDHKLFHAEMVAPGAEFTAALCMDLRAIPPQLGKAAPHDIAAHPRCALAEAKAVLADLRAILVELAAEESWSIGKYQADGCGEIRLEKVDIHFDRLGKSGTFERFNGPGFAPEDFAIAKLRAAKKAEPRGMRFSFTCRGPFLVLDSTKSRKRGASRDPESNDPHLVAQSWRENVVMLVGTSLSGVLRAKAAWLAECNDPADVIVRDGNISVLKPLDLLMGATGFRALMTVRNLALEGGRQEDIMSVKLDRFTGGTIDNALFKTRAYTGTNLSFGLVLDEDRLGKLVEGNKLAIRDAEAARALFHQLVDDLNREPLMLGHGTNKGFGWFEPVKKVA